MQTISVREANQNFSRYLNAVDHGEELIITKRGREIARLVPVVKVRPRSLNEVSAALRARLDKHTLPTELPAFVRDDCYED